MDARINRRSLVLGAPFVLLACDRKKPQPPGVDPRIGSLTPPIQTPTGSWQAQHSVNVTLVPEGRGFYFDFPPAPGSVHYLITPRSFPLSGTVSMTCRVEGAGTLAHLPTAGVDDQTLPAFRLYFQRHGDNLSGVGRMCDFRWWNSPTLFSKDGEIRITTPLHPDYWGNVCGQKNEIGFNEAINDPWYMGFTCGSQSFAGHGVRSAPPPVRFHMMDYSVAL